MPLIEEIRERSHKVNDLLSAGKPQEALEQAHALRDHIQKQNSTDAEVKAELEHLNSAIGQLELAGYKVTRINLPKMPNVELKPSRPSPVFLILCAIILLGIMGYFVMGYLNYNAYKEQAQKVIDELEKIQATTQVGINYQRYGEKLPDVQLAVNKLKEKYDGKNESGYASYKAVIRAANEYSAANTFWKLKIDGGGKEAEQGIQDAWESADKGIKEAKQHLEQRE